MVLADVAFADRASFLTRRAEDLRRVGTHSSNRTEWERHVRTRSRIKDADPARAQMAVWHILKSLPFSCLSAEHREWMTMAFSAQLVALGLQVRFIQYARIVLQPPSSVVGSWVGWNVPNRWSQIVVLMPKFTVWRS